MEVNSQTSFLSLPLEVLFIILGHVEVVGDETDLDALRSCSSEMLGLVHNYNEYRLRLRTKPDGALIPNIGRVPRHIAFQGLIDAHKLCTCDKPFVLFCYAGQMRRVWRQAGQPDTALAESVLEYKSMTMWVCIQHNICLRAQSSTACAEEVAQLEMPRRNDVWSNNDFLLLIAFGIIYHESVRLQLITIPAHSMFSDRWDGGTITGYLLPTRFAMGDRSNPDCNSSIQSFPLLFVNMDDHELLQSIIPPKIKAAIMVREPEYSDDYNRHYQNYVPYSKYGLGHTYIHSSASKRTLGIYDVATPYYTPMNVVLGAFTTYPSVSFSSQDPRLGYKEGVTIYASLEAPDPDDYDGGLMYDESFNFNGIEISEYEARA